MYAKHTVWYDALPHYFMEFDIFDREKEIFLDTPSRREMTASLPIASVPVLAEGSFADKEMLLGYLGDSRYKSKDHWEHLRQAAEREGLDPERVLRETDPSPAMEGLYIKIEEGGQVVDRMKFVRAGFYQCVEAAEGHWQNKPIIPNGLAIPLEEIYAPALRRKE